MSLFISEGIIIINYVKILYVFGEMYSKNNWGKQNNELFLLDYFCYVQTSENVFLKSHYFCFYFFKDKIKHLSLNNNWSFV